MQQQRATRQRFDLLQHVTHYEVRPYAEVPPQVQEVGFTSKNT
jgi:hypothetical protein